MTDPKDAIVRDAEIYKKVICESLVVCGYRVHDSQVEVTKGFERSWIVEFRIEVER
jgi:hypothetical protein